MNEIQDTIHESIECISALVSENARLTKLASDSIQQVQAISSNMKKLASAPKEDPVPEDLLRKAASALDANGLLGGITTDDIVGAWKKNPATLATTITKLASRLAPESGSSLGRLKSQNKPSNGSRPSSASVWNEVMTSKV